MGSLRDIVLTVFILGLLPAVLMRPWWGILLWTWVGLMNPHKMTWSFAYNFPFAMIIAIVTIFAIFISREPKKLPLTPPVVLLILFNVWMAVTTILFALYPEYAWPKLEKVIKIQLFIFLTMIVMQSEQRIRALVLVATLSIAFFGIKGGIYTIAKGGGGMVLGPDGGFISGNTEIALALVVTLPLMRWLQLQTERRWLRMVATVCMILIAVSILGSYSRGGLLALFAMAVFFWLKSRKKALLGIMLMAVGASFTAFMPDQWHAKMGTIENYEADSSAKGRIGAWKFALNLAKHRPDRRRRLRHVPARGLRALGARRTVARSAQHLVPNHGRTRICRTWACSCCMWLASLAHRRTDHRVVPGAQGIDVGAGSRGDDPGRADRILGRRELPGAGVLGLSVHPHRRAGADQGRRAKTARRGKRSGEPAPTADRLGLPTRA